MKVSTTYRKKLILFIFSSAILLSLVYAFGFRKCVNASKSLAFTREQAEIVKSSALLKAELETRLNMINSQLGNLQVIEGDQEYILNTVNQGIDIGHVRIIEISGTATQTDNGIVKNTYGATVEGNFIDLVKLVRTFEESGHDGNIASATFYRYNDNKTKRTSTRLLFFIQKYKAL